MCSGLRPPRPAGQAAAGRRPTGTEGHLRQAQRQFTTRRLCMYDGTACSAIHALGSNTRSLIASPCMPEWFPSATKLDCFGTLRRRERLQSVDEVKEDSEATSYGGPRKPQCDGPRKPQCSCGASLCLRLFGVRMRREFHAPPLAALDTLGSPKGSGLVQAVLSAGAPFMPHSMSQRSGQSEGTSRTFGAACSTARKTHRPTFLTGSILVFP